MSEIVSRIQKAYESDQARGFKYVFDAKELPRSFEEITREWLTGALCVANNMQGAVDDVEVESFELGPVDDGTSNRRRISITYKESGKTVGAVANLPNSVFCKATHNLANRVAVGACGGAKCEVDYYTYVRPHLNIETPKAYYAKYDPDSFNSLIILEDLTENAQSFCDEKTPMNRARAESQLRLLAELHGAACAKKDITDNLHHFSTWQDFFERTLAFGMEEGTKNGVDESREFMPDSLKSVSTEKMWELMLRSVTRHDELPATLTHGDVHLKNWYVAGSGEMGLSDWQCCTRGHWSRDVCYTIATALQIEDRRAWERELLAFYLEELGRCGGPVMSFEDAWLNYRQQLMTALTFWAVTLCPAAGMPDMQPRTTTLEFLRRILTAMDDVDTIGAFN